MVVTLHVFEVCLMYFKCNVKAIIINKFLGLYLSSTRRSK